VPRALLSVAFLLQEEQDKAGMTDNLKSTKIILLILKKNKRKNK